MQYYFNIYGLWIKNSLFSAYLRAVKAIFRSKNLSITFLSRNFVIPKGSVEISYEGANRGAQHIEEAFCENERSAE